MIAGHKYDSCVECFEPIIPGGTTCPHCASDQIEEDEA